jgi:hypothetical protein
MLVNVLVDYYFDNSLNKLKYESSGVDYTYADNALFYK